MHTVTGTCFIVSKHCESSGGEIRTHRFPWQCLQRLCRDVELLLCWAFAVCWQRCWLPPDAPSFGIWCSVDRMFYHFYFVPIPWKKKITAFTCKVLQVYLSFWRIRKCSPSFGLPLTVKVRQPPGRCVLLGARARSHGFLPAVWVGALKTRPSYPGGMGCCCSLVCYNHCVRSSGQKKLWDLIPTFFLQFIRLPGFIG